MEIAKTVHDTLLMLALGAASFGALASAGMLFVAIRQNHIQSHFRPFVSSLFALALMGGASNLYRLIAVVHEANHSLLQTDWALMLASGGIGVAWLAMAAVLFKNRDSLHSSIRKRD